MLMYDYQAYAKEVSVSGYGNGANRAWSMSGIELFPSARIFSSTGSHTAHHATVSFTDRATASWCGAFSLRYMELLVYMSTHE